MRSMSRLGSLTAGLSSQRTGCTPTSRGTGDKRRACYDFLHFSLKCHRSPPFRVILDLIVWFLHQTFIDLLLHPFSKVDSWHIKSDLSPPMHRGRIHTLSHPNLSDPLLIPSGNYEELMEMCLMDDELRTMVVNADPAWSFVNEGTPERPKVSNDSSYICRLNKNSFCWNAVPLPRSSQTGYVSNTPGSKLGLVLQMAQLVTVAEIEGAKSGDKKKSEAAMVSSWS